MKLQKIATIMLGILLTAVVLASLILSILNAKDTSNPILLIILQSSALIAVLCAWVYMSRGGRKSAAGWFLLFNIFLAITFFLTLLRGIQQSYDLIGCAISALAFGLVCILIAAKDLGRARSFTICTLIALCEIALILLTSMNHFDITRFLGLIANVILVFVQFSMIELKYIDKAERKGNVS